MKERKSNPMRCSRDIRSYPWQSYLLPDDGRVGRHLAEQRRALAVQLASYADGDGTRITVGISRVLTELGWARTTLFRRLDELGRIPGFLQKIGLTEEHGTAKRIMDVSKLKMPGEAGVPTSPSEVPDTQPEVSDSGHQKFHVAQAGIPDTKAEVPDSGTEIPRIRGTQPPPDRHRTATQPTLAWLAHWMKKQTTTMGVPTSNQKSELREIANRYGEHRTNQAVELFKNRKQGLDGLKHPWAMFINQAPEWLEITSDPDADLKLANDIADRTLAEEERRTAGMRKSSEEAAGDLNDLLKDAGLDLQTP